MALAGATGSFSSNPAIHEFNENSRPQYARIFVRLAAGESLCSKPIEPELPLFISGRVSVPPMTAVADSIYIRSWAAYPLVAAA